MIKIERIKRLANGSKVKTTAVENFLGTLNGMSRTDAVANLFADAKSYKWNNETINAILTGINENYLPMNRGTE